jgi:hypothetical protein
MKVTKIPLIDKLYLVGPPGIGKTEVIYQKASAEASRKNKIFVDLRNIDNVKFENILKYPQGYYVYYRIIATHVFPEDLGIPRIQGNNGHDFVEFLPPKVLKILSIPQIEGVLFIDELSNVQRDDQIAMLYSLLQEKEASWIFKLSPKIKIICAGNNPEWSEIVRELPKPLRNRLIILNVESPSLDEWLQYMEKQYGDKWDKFTYGYLKLYPSDFLKNTEASENYPTPRSWTNLALLLYNIQDEEIIDELAVGCLGKEVGSKFTSIRRTKLTEEEINSILAFPSKFGELNMNKKLLVLYSVASRITPQNYKQYLGFLNYLEKEREFLILIISMMSKEVKTIIIKEMKSVLVPILKQLMSFELGEQ